MTIEQDNAKEEVIEIMERCNKCGLCKELCPIFKVLRQEDCSPRGHAILLSNKIFSELVWNCTLCKACEEKCPLNLKICTAIRKARQVLNLKGQEPYENKKVLERIMNKQNPFLVF